jgi:LuxR family maltose regulon positive regulatory protein
VLTRVRSGAEAAGRLSVVIETLVLQALGSDGRGEPSRASALLEQALMLAEPGSYVRTFLDEGTPLAALLRRLVPTGSVPQYLGTLLAAFDRQASRVQPATGTLAGEEFSSGATQALIDPLSVRELEVLRLVAVGRSNREIARELIVTVGTVKKHVNNIFGKLEVQSRTQAVARARELGLLP